MGRVIPFSKVRRPTEEELARLKAEDQANLYREHAVIHFLLDHFRIPAIAARRPFDERAAIAEIRARFPHEAWRAESIVNGMVDGQFDDGVGPCDGPCCAHLAEPEGRG